MKRLEVYHDESYRNNKRFLIIGLLWVDSNNKISILKELKKSRQKNNYYGKIHYRTLTDHSPKRKTAIEWYQKAIWCLNNNLKFYLLSIDRCHPKYENERFRYQFHEYNRFTALSLFSSFRWFFLNSSAIISMFSDFKIRRPGGEKVGNGITSDNFEEYLIKRINMDLSKTNNQNDSIQFFINEQYPKCNKQYLKNIQVISTPDQHIMKRSPQEEFIQLCDLLLGSFGSIFSNSIPSKNKKGKRYLYIKSKKLIRDMEKKHYNKKYNLYKKLWAGHFPNTFGKIGLGRAKKNQVDSMIKLDKWLAQ